MITRIDWISASCRYDRANTGRAAPHRETMGLFLHRDAFHRSCGRIDDINRIVVATREPKRFSIDADITHIRTAAARWPVVSDLAGREVDDGNAAFPFGRPHTRATPVSHVELGAVAARVKSVRPETGFDVAHSP